MFTYCIVWGKTRNNKNGQFDSNFQKPEVKILSESNFEFMTPSFAYLVWQWVECYTDRGVKFHFDFNFSKDTNQISEKFIFLKYEPTKVVE